MIRGAAVVSTASERSKDTKKTFVGFRLPCAARRGGTQSLEMVTSRESGHPTARATDPGRASDVRRSVSAGSLGTPPPRARDEKDARSPEESSQIRIPHSTYTQNDTCIGSTGSTAGIMFKAVVHCAAVTPSIALCSPSPCIPGIPVWLR